MNNKPNHMKNRDAIVSDSETHGPGRPKYDDILAGRNCVNEALRSGRTLDSVYVARGERTGSIGAIIAKCRDQGVPIKEVAPIKLDSMCGGAMHQGIAAVTAAHEYASVDDIFALAASRNESPFIIMADEIEDPHNLGAIIRTAEAAGAHGVIIPKRRSAGLTITVARAACGALEYVPVARVGSLVAEIALLKERGVWIYAADMSGQPWCQTDFSGAVALVIGSEGQGIGRLIKEKCDVAVSLPMSGNIASLNASVAAGILMYEVARQKQGLKTKY